MNTINTWFYTRNWLSPIRHTQNQNMFTFYKSHQFSSTQIKFFQLITMEYQANSGRMAPGCATAAKQKWAYCHDERNWMVLGFMGFAQLVTPENKYLAIRLANLMVLFIIIAVNYKNIICKGWFVKGCKGCKGWKRVVWFRQIQVPGWHQILKNLTNRMADKMWHHSYLTSHWSDISGFWVTS